MDEIEEIIRSAKKCPFCGSNALYTRRNGSYGYTSDGARVECSLCFCKTNYQDIEDWEAGKGTFSIEEKTCKDLVNLWNKRIETEVENK